MFDIAPTELLLCAVIALVVIGPKDLPKAMRVVGYWVGRARGVARHFRAGIDTMMRESELAEMEKQWAEENERIMREHPAAPDAPPVPMAADAVEPAPPVPPLTDPVEPAPPVPPLADGVPPPATAPHDTDQGER